MTSLVQAINSQSAASINIPTNVNPFAYLIEDGRERFAAPISGATAVILGILLVFHSLIVVFCSFILIISYTSGSKQARWFVQKLYIKDSKDENVYKKPLYFLNAGILMNVSQLLCSSVASAYMWIQIKCSQSPEYALHAQLMSCLGLIYIFETLSNWSMTHCFLVTIYFSRGFDGDPKSRITGWISSPLFINLFFVGFPIFVTLATVGLMSWTTVLYNNFTHKLVKLIDQLNRGSSAWDALHDPSQSDQAKAQSGAQMVEILTDLATISNTLNSRVERFLKAFRISQGVLLALVCISCVVFIRMFFMLIGKYRRPGRQYCCTKETTSTDWFPSWLKRETFGDPSAGRCDETNTTNMSVVLPNRQFFYLLLRAFGVFLSMVTQITVLFLGAWKARDIMTIKGWRGITTWLLTLSSVWSAAPIAWQCWKLYTDEAKTRSSAVTENIDSSSRSIPNNDDSPDNTKFDTKFDVQLPRESPSTLPPFS